VYKSPVKEHAREKHTEMIGDEAADEVVELAEEYIDKLLREGTMFKEAAGRTTLYKDDIQKAAEAIDRS
jgi:Core histone H2A/H2B/H3/H4.